MINEDSKFDHDDFSMSIADGNNEFCLYSLFVFYVFLYFSLKQVFHKLMVQYICLLIDCDTNESINLFLSSN